MIDMPLAFVLINTEIGSLTKVLNELKKVEGVKEAFSVYGVYDIIAKVESETMSDVKLVVSRLRKLNNVRTTLTMLVTEEV